MLNKLSLTLAIAIISLVGATNTVFAINLGEITTENEVPETMAESSFDPANPGINFGLCAGFTNIADGSCDITSQDYNILIDEVAVESQENIEESIEESVAPNQRQVLVQEQPVAPSPEAPAPSPTTALSPEAPASSPALAPFEATAIESLEATTEVTDGAEAEETPAEELGQVLGVSSEKTPFEIYLDAIKRRFNNSGAYVQAGTPLRTHTLVLLLIISALTFLVFRTEYQIRKMEQYINKSDRKIDFKMHSAMEKHTGIKIITIKKIRKNRPSTKSKGGSITVIKNAKARAKYFKKTKK